MLINFFINCGPNLANKIDISGKPEFKSYLDGNNVDTLFKFVPISVEELVRRLKKDEENMVSEDGQRER